MAAPIVVKMLSSKGIYVDYHAIRQFPGGVPEWGNVQFLFDRNAASYDWLVVYHDIPYGKKETGVEELQCPRENTVLVTHEPSGIKSYGKDFSAQFGWLLSCHETWALPHSKLIPMHPGSIWIYGADYYNPSYRGKYDYDEIKNTAPPNKSRGLSTVCSDKKMRRTLHWHRFQFTTRLKSAMPEMDVFGHGVNLIEQKADALDPYRYHLAVENYICPHYWTEKLADAFLGYTLPFYCGAPNAADYFPEESFIPIDINNFDGALETIRRAIADKEYEKRLPHIIEARRRVLDEHNLYAMLAKTIGKLPQSHGETGGVLFRSLSTDEKKSFGGGALFF